MLWIHSCYPYCCGTTGCPVILMSCWGPDVALVMWPVMWPSSPISTSSRHGYSNPTYLPLFCHHHFFIWLFLVAPFLKSYAGSVAMLFNSLKCLLLPLALLLPIWDNLSSVSSMSSDHGITMCQNYALTTAIPAYDSNLFWTVILGFWLQCCKKPEIAPAYLFLIIYATWHISMLLLNKHDTDGTIISLGTPTYSGTAVVHAGQMLALNQNQKCPKLPSYLTFSKPNSWYCAPTNTMCLLPACWTIFAIVLVMLPLLLVKCRLKTKC